MNSLESLLIFYLYNILAFFTSITKRQSEAIITACSNMIIFIHCLLFIFLFNFCIWNIFNYQLRYYIILTLIKDLFKLRSKKLSTFIKDSFTFPAHGLQHTNHIFEPQSASSLKSSIIIHRGYPSSSLRSPIHNYHFTQTHLPGVISINRRNIYQDVEVFMEQSYAFSL